MTSTPIAWDPVRDFTYRVLGGRTTTITCGSAEWCDLPDEHPDKIVALLIAGSRWCLETELDQIDQRRIDAKHAAIEVATALDWTRVAKRIRDRDRFYRNNIDLRRKKVS